MHMRTSVVCLHLRHSLSPPQTTWTVHRSDLHLDYRDITHQLFTLDKNVEGISFAGGNGSGMASDTIAASASVIMVAAVAMRITEVNRKSCREAMVSIVLVNLSLVGIQVVD